MNLAIADPPYLGRARRWYGDGRGHAGGRGVADQHPDAAHWDDPGWHRALVAELADYDGWAIAAAPSSLPVYLAVVPDVRVMVWHRPNAVPSGHRVRSTWEAVLVNVPPERRAYGTGLPTNDVLECGVPQGRFAGAKPEAWTRWVLAALGYQPSDRVRDLFPGSGAVGRVLEQRVLL